MLENYFDNEVFDTIDFTKTIFKKGEYIDCVFEHCNFENQHLSNIQFIDCEFIDCNFSYTIVKDTAFRDVIFCICKVVGVNFNECNPFLLKFSFEICKLDFSSFYNLKIHNTVFNECNLDEVDFTEADLTNSWFHISDFKNAIFDNTNLEKTDFKTSFNFSINPEKNKLKGAKFSKENSLRLLSKYNIIIE